jgi:hypothetical protein
LAGDPSLFRRKYREKLAKEGRGEEIPSQISTLDETIVKLVELKKMISKYFPPDEIQGILSTAQI